MIISIEAIQEFDGLVKLVKENIDPEFEIKECDNPDLKIFIDWCYGDTNLMRAVFSSGSKSDLIDSFKKSSYKNELIVDIITINYSFLNKLTYPGLSLELFKPRDTIAIKKNLPKLANFIIDAIHDYY